jgi:type IV secretory pathway TrbD component
MSEQPEKKSLAEKMVSAGEKMEGAGKATSSAGCGVMGFMLALFVVAVFGFLLYVVAC